MAGKRKTPGQPCSSDASLNGLWPPSFSTKTRLRCCFRSGSFIKIRSSNTRMATPGIACSSKVFNCSTASVRKIACAFASPAATCRSALVRRAQEPNTLLGLTSLITRDPPMLPKLNRRRAQFVLTKIDEILAWEQRKEAEKDTRFVELGRYLCEVRAGQYWRVENLKSFDEFLEKRFPESRRKAYYLMSIHEHLPPQVRKELKEVGWTKGLELAKLARRDGQEFDCATWLHKAREMPKDEFRCEV